MISVVSQMLRQDLNTFRGHNISDPHHFAATFHLRGLLNTSISHPTPNNTPYLRGLSNHLHFFHTPSINIPYPEGSLQLWASSISAIVHVLHRRNPHGGITAYVVTGPVIPTRQHLSKELFAIPAPCQRSPWIFKRIKIKTIDNISHIGQPWPARVRSNRTPPRAQVSSCQPSLQPSLQSTIFIKSC